MGLFDDELNEEFDDSEFDDGVDKRLKKSKDNVSDKRVKPSKNPKHALKADVMFFAKEEQDTYKEYYERFKEDIVEKYGEFSTTHELSLNVLCYTVLRLRRKSRLESHFGRFMDRQAPHDPVTQTLNTLKFLGLSPEKQIAEEGGKSALGKLLAQDAEEFDGEEIQSVDNSYEAWLASRTTEKLELRTPKVIPSYVDEDLIIESEEENL